MSDDELRIESVTGVDVSLPVAGAGGRSFAFVIDWHIRVVVAIAWWLVASFAYFGAWTLIPGEGADGGIGYFWIVILPPLVIYLFYHPILEIAMRGRTPGKRLAGVRIVTREGATPSVGALLLRNVFRVIDSLPTFYCVGLGFVLISRQKVRLGDLAAGTLLIYDEGDSLPLPTDLTGSTNSRIDGKLRDLIDDVIARWKELSPEARIAFGNQIRRRADPSATAIQDEQQMLEALKDSARW